MILGGVALQLCWAPPPFQRFAKNHELPDPRCANLKTTPFLHRWIVLIRLRGFEDARFPDYCNLSFQIFQNRCAFSQIAFAISASGIPGAWQSMRQVWSLTIVSSDSARLASGS